MSELWNIIQAHLDAYGVREAEFARRMGSAPQTLSNWKHRGLRDLPERRLLEAVAVLTNTDYLRVLNAALVDIGYRDTVADNAVEDAIRTDPTLPEQGRRLMVVMLHEMRGATPDSYSSIRTWLGAPSEQDIANIPDPEPQGLPQDAGSME